MNVFSGKTSAVIGLDPHAGQHFLSLIIKEELTKKEFHDFIQWMCNYQETHSFSFVGAIKKRPFQTEIQLQLSNYPDEKGKHYKAVIIYVALAETLGVVSPCGVSLNFTLLPFSQSESERLKFLRVIAKNPVT